MLGYNMHVRIVTFCIIEQYANANCLAVSVMAYSERHGFKPISRELRLKPQRTLQDRFEQVLHFGERLNQNPVCPLR